MLRRISTVLLVLVFAALLVVPAAAQSYDFSMDKMDANVYWNADGTLSLDYVLTYTNQPGGHVIDFVDVGLPTNTFNINDIQADINGNPLKVTSDFQGPSGYGVAVDMGPYAIQPGKSGTIHVRANNIPRVLYTDDNDSNYASAAFAPLYYQGSVISGSTDMTVTFHLPPGIQPSEPRWHAAPDKFPSEPQTGTDPQGRITYTWHNPNADGSQQYQFGASFPKSYIPADSIQSKYIPPPSSLPSFSIPFGSIFNCLCVLFFGFMVLGIPILNAVGSQRRKLQYISPRIAIEGHGIKRGLTAVEAAILLGEPLDKIMTMILFGTIKKNAATVTSRDPLQVQVTSPLPEGLNEYEVDFLNAFKESDPRTRRNLLQDMMVKLVKSVSQKMKGFSRKETIDYYKSIMEKAWAQVEQADTPEVKGQVYDQNLEWTMLDKDYGDRTRRVFTGPVFVPTWWGRYDPTFGRSMPGAGHVSTPTPSSSRSMPSVPSLPGSDFAASVAVGMQTFSQKAIGNVGDFTSRVTNVTNPPPPPSKSGGSWGGGSGGHSCACACACAGCACACAGGGR
jgi:hypothetical protein